MKAVIAATFVALFAPAAALAQEPGTGEEDPSIVVTGMRLQDTERALEECLARGCPPEEDIRLSLAHAENQFIQGMYANGQKTLRGSISRTDNAAERLPIPVSGLYRASARIAQHMGEARDYRAATLDARDTLEKGLGSDNWRTLAAEIEVGDSRAKLGYPEEAERIYRRVEENALELGQNRVASYARLRLAMLDYARWQDQEYELSHKRKALEQLDRIADNPLPGGEEFVLAARVLRAKIDRADGEAASTEALLKAFAENGGVRRPVLVYTEPLQMVASNASAFGSEMEVSASSSSTGRLTASSFGKPRWADIGFFIGEDGRVGEVEILRSEGSTDWLDHVIENIATRRYAPIAQDEARPGFYQIERYTLTAHFADETTGTRLRMREPVVRIERLDITPENYAGQNSHG